MRPPALSYRYPLIFSVGLLLGSLTMWASRPCPARAAGTADVKLTDPWGQVGQEISVRAVEVGGLECAVMVSGVERRTAIWCRPR